MAKHRKPKSITGRRKARERQKTRGRRSASVVLLGTAAAAMSTVLVLGHATNSTADNLELQLAAIAIGIGGRGDPDAVNVPNKISGAVIPLGATYIPVHYPAGFDIDNSTAAGLPVLHQIITDNLSNGNLVVVSYSEGTIIAENEKRALAAQTTPPTNVFFTMVASPNVPNGGIFSRFPTLKIPFFVSSNGPAQPTAYLSIYHTNEYDPYGDFPAYFNPLSLANTLLAIEYVHPDQYYDSDVEFGPNDLVKVVNNSAGGTDTYHFYLADHLPLLAPARQIFGIVGLTPLTEPILGLIEPLIRLGVDMGYTDRLNLNPETPIQFSFFTPPDKILQALAELPGAVDQGANNFVTGVSSLPSSIPAPLAPTSSTLALAPADGPSINAKVAPPSSPPPPSNPGNPLNVSPLTLTKQGPELNKLNTADVDPGTNSPPKNPTSPVGNSLLTTVTGTLTNVLGGTAPGTQAPTGPPSPATQPGAA